MGILSPRNVVEESRFLFNLTGLLGLRAAQIRGKAWASYIYATLLVLGYGAFFLVIRDYASRTFDENERLVPSTDLRRFQFHLNPLLLSLMICPSCVKSWKIDRVLGQLEKLDETFSFLNVRFRYDRQMKREIVHLIGVILSTILLDLIDYNGLRGPGPPGMFVFVWICSRIPEFVNTVMMCAFSIWLWKIRTRFAEVNKVLESMVSRGDRDAEHEARYNFIDASRLRMLRQIHGKLRKLALTVNEAYEFQLLVTFVVLFVYMCVRIHIICSMDNIMGNLIDFLIEIFWLTSYFIKYFYLAEAAHSTAIRAKRASEFLHEFRIGPGRQMLRGEMRNFSWELFDQNIQFTACNLFPIDYSTLRVLAIIASAYTFLTVQLSSIRGG